MAKGKRISLDQHKLKALFSAMLIAPQIKYIAYALGTSMTAVTNWIKAGESLQEEFADKLEELKDVYPWEYEAYWENKKEQYDAEFRMIHNLEPESTIPDRMFIDYNNYMNNEKRKFIESNVYRKENEILNSIKLSDDEMDDYDFKMLINFARIYNRGRCVVEMGYLANVNRHASTSKNVQLSLKMLEKMNKEDFGEQQEVRHTGSVEVNSTSILQMALGWESSQKQLEQNNQNVIDVQTIKQIESKE